MKKPRIVVEISGGVCVAISSEVDAEVHVLDWDNAEAGDEISPELKKLAETLPLIYQ